MITFDLIMDKKRVEIECLWTFVAQIWSKKEEVMERISVLDVGMQQC